MQCPNAEGIPPSSFSVVSVVATTASSKLMDQRILSLVNKPLKSIESQLAGIDSRLDRQGNSLFHIDTKLMNSGRGLADAGAALQDASVQAFFSEKKIACLCSITYCPSAVAPFRGSQKLQYLCITRSCMKMHYLIHTCFTLGSYSA